MDRKLVKQTVMTSVYGVTYIGARDQIKRRLKERGAFADESEIFGASCYAAKVGKEDQNYFSVSFFFFFSHKFRHPDHWQYFILLLDQVTLTALGEMFEAARSIMRWLGECAKVFPSHSLYIFCSLCILSLLFFYFFSL